MTYYYTLFLISLLLGSILIPNKKVAIMYRNKMEKHRGGKVYLFIVFTCVFLLIGLRGISVGADTFGYTKLYFEGVKVNGIFASDMEIFNNVLVSISLVFSQDYRLWLLINGLLVSILFAKYIFDNSDDIVLSTLIFLGMFFVQSMNLMRQWLAIAIGLNALTLYRKGNNKSALVTLIVAYLTHTTAIVLLFVPFFEKLKNKKLGLVLTGMGCLLFFAFKDVIMNGIVILHPSYYGYINDSYFISEGGFNIKDLIFLGIEVLCIYQVIFNKYRLSESEINRYYFYASLMIIALTFSLTGQRFGMLHRVVYYYSSFLIILLPEVISKSKFRFLFRFALIVSMFVMLQRNSYFDNNLVAQYYFFWQE